VNPLFAVILGLVQGVSEWLPVSSKTQVLFASSFLFSLPLAVAYAFGLFMEISSIGSAITYFGLLPYPSWELKGQVRESEGPLEADSVHYCRL